MNEWPHFRVAIASSGLGHVARGIETWARDMAVALREAGVDVTLFTGGPTDVPGAVALIGPRRFDRRTQRLIAWMPRFAWRWGLKDGYGWEQFAFWLKLWPRLRRGRVDFLHVQDPMLADWCRRWRRCGLLRTREILAHGTEEPASFLARFDRVQHLAPWHLEQAEKALVGAGRSPAQRGTRLPSRAATSEWRRLWMAIPNFVDTDVFRPARDDAERRAFRGQLGVPPDVLLVGCAAAIKRSHKRIDYLLREFAAFGRNANAHLVIAGARQPDTDMLRALANELAPERIHFCCDLARERMPAFYRALDVFVLPSLFEMMPIALLEALASGVPALVNRHPVLEWMIGVDSLEPAGGRAIDMARDGALAEAFAETDAAWRQGAGAAARGRAERLFAKPVVIGEVIAYYQRILRAGV